MKRAITVGVSGITFAFLLSSNALPGAELPPQIQQAMQETNRDVIVILRDQRADVPPIRRAMGPRAAALAASQSSVMSSLPRLEGRKFHAFSTINAFATSVSAAEMAQLNARTAEYRPSCPMPSFVRPLASSEASESGEFLPVPPRSAAAATDGGLCNTLEPEALQVTNTAFADPTIPQAQQVRDGNGQFVTGKGVKVAWIADGLDPNIPAFIRPDGSHVFIDYQDFTGDPAGTPTGGEEAFGDAGTIAAQDMPEWQAAVLRYQPICEPGVPAALALQHPNSRHGARRFAGGLGRIRNRRLRRRRQTSCRPSSTRSFTTMLTSSTNHSAAIRFPTIRTIPYRWPTMPP